MKWKALIAGTLVAAAIEYVTPAHSAEILCQEIVSGPMLADRSAVTTFVDGSLALLGRRHPE